MSGWRVGSGRGPDRRWWGQRGAAGLAAGVLSGSTLLGSLLLPGAAGVARAAGPGPSPAPTATPRAVDLTGHWAVAGTSGFDIRQEGTAIRGSSVAGITFSGTLAGREAGVRFWEGRSFAKADPEDRGTARLTLDGTGRLLLVRWTAEKPSAGSLPPVFTAVRVLDIADPPRITWFTAENMATATWLAENLRYPLEVVILYLLTLDRPASAADRTADLQLYEILMYWWRDWDRAHRIRPLTS